MTFRDFRDPSQDITATRRGDVANSNISIPRSWLWSRAGSRISPETRPENPMTATAYSVRKPEISAPSARSNYRRGSPITRELYRETQADWLSHSPPNRRRPEPAESCGVLSYF